MRRPEVLVWSRQSILPWLMQNCRDAQHLIEIFVRLLRFFYVYPGAWLDSVTPCSRGHKFITIKFISINKWILPYICIILNPGASFDRVNTCSCGYSGCVASLVLRQRAMALLGSLHQCIGLIWVSPYTSTRVYCFIGLISRRSIAFNASKNCILRFNTFLIFFLFTCCSLASIASL